MSKEKQIEIIGIKKTLCLKPCDICSHYGKKSPCVHEYTANRLYEAGYRKQEEGEWVFKFSLDDYNFYECSVCGRQECLLAKESTDEYFPYCHCGAKMKGGAE